MKLVKADQMRRIDREAIDGHKIPSEHLMENAGGGIAASILANLIPTPSSSRIAVVCGKGNNGGDGFVVARHLHRAGATVNVYFVGPQDALSEDAKLNYERAGEAGLKPVELKSIDDFPIDMDVDFVIDAIFGTGFERAPRGLTAELIECINDIEAEVIAVDMPSGLNADNGQCEGVAVAADYTYTLALPKYGLFVSPGRELAGQVEIIPIGIPESVEDSFAADCLLTTLDHVSELLPERKADGHKGDFGKLFVLAGSTGMTGAAAMAALSALRSGCGLVNLGIPEAVLPIVAQLAMEAVSHPLSDVGRKGKLALRSLGEVRALADANDAVIIGPGIGRHRETSELIRRFFAQIDKPCLIDADGLNAFVGHTDLIKNAQVTPVLTPHAGEFRRLFERDVTDEIHERIALARATAVEYDIVLVLKGSPTIVATPESECWLNSTGNHGMATGGSGDVLSGIIGSFLAQGMDAADAAVAGVFIHGMAGDFAADRLTARSMIASDMIDSLPDVFELVE